MTRRSAPPRLHVAFAALGLGFLAIFSWVFFREQGAEWRAAQARFRELEATVKNPHQLAQSAGAAGVRQVWLPDLGRVDRCTTCHLGVDDPAFANAPALFRTPPGDVADHAPRREVRLHRLPRRPGRGDRLRPRRAPAHPRRRARDAPAGDDRGELRHLPPLARASRRPAARRGAAPHRGVGLRGVPRHPGLRGGDASAARPSTAWATRCGPTGWRAGSRTRRAISRTPGWATSA